MYSEILILLWTIKGARPVITHERITQPSVWTNLGICVLCELKSSNLMFPFSETCPALFLTIDFLWLKLLTSGWPSAPHLTSLASTAADAAQRFVCVESTNNIHAVQGHMCRKSCPINTSDTVARQTNNTDVMQPPKLCVALVFGLYCSRLLMKSEPFSQSLSSILS